MTMANEKGSSISSKKIMKMLEKKMKELKLSSSEENKLRKKPKQKRKQEK